MIRQLSPAIFAKMAFTLSACVVYNRRHKAEFKGGSIANGAWRWRATGRQAGTADTSLGAIWHGRPTYRRPKSRCSGRRMPKAGPLYLHGPGTSRPGTSASRSICRGRLRKRNRPENQIQAIRIHDAGLGTASRRHRLCHERHGTHARPRGDVPTLAGPTTFSIAIVVRRNESRFDSLGRLQQDGIRVSTLGDTAASRLLTQEGIPYRTYDSQTTPYKDLEQNATRRRAVGSADRRCNTPSATPIQPEAEVRRQADRSGFLRHGFRKENEALAAQFDAAIGRLLANGTLQRSTKLGLVERRPGRLGDGQARRSFKLRPPDGPFPVFSPVSWAERR